MEALSGLQLAACILAALVGGWATALVGTGGLITIPVYLLVGVPPFMALGTNKAALWTGLLFSSVQYARSAMVRWDFLKRALVPGIALPGLATWATLNMDGGDWAWAVALVVLLATLASYPGRSLKERYLRLPTWARSPLFVLIWIYDGFAGPLAGAMYFLGLNKTGSPTDYQESRLDLGTSRWLQFLSVTGSTGFLIARGQVLWDLWLYLAVASVAGHQLGAVMGSKLNLAAIRWILFGFCLASSLSLLVKL